MVLHKKLAGFLIVLALLLPACGGGGQGSEVMPLDPPAATEAMTEKENSDVSGSNMGGVQEPMEAPAYFSAGLVDVTSGDTFRIGDFQGKVVLVETLAMWCSNCLRQQKEVKALHDALGDRDDFVSVGLDIDPNEDQVALKGYVDRNGFNWKYAIASPEVAREIGQLYGTQFLNPPSTPMLIIDRHGEVHPLPFGIKSVADLEQALAPFLNEGM